MHIEGEGKKNVREGNGGRKGLCQHNIRHCSRREISFACCVPAVIILVGENSVEGGGDCREKRAPPPTAKSPWGTSWNPETLEPGTLELPAATLERLPEIAYPICNSEGSP